MTDFLRGNGARAWFLRLFVLYLGVAVAIAYLLVSAPALLRALTEAPALNWALNLVILGAFVVGLALTFSGLLRAWREESAIHRFYAMNFGDGGRDRPPAEGLWHTERLGGTVIRERTDLMSVLATGVAAYDAGAIADALADREEPRVAVARYTSGALVLLGLLGTFVGLLITIGGISELVDSIQLKPSDDIDAFLIPLKAGLKEPLEGMGVAFSTSLLGLAASLILGAGTLALQAAQASWMGKLEALTALHLAPELGARRGAHGEPAHGGAPTGPGLQRLEASTRFLRDAQAQVGEHVARLESASARIAGSLGDFRERVAALAGQIERVETLLARIADGQGASRQTLNDLSIKLADLATAAAAVQAEVRDGQGAFAGELRAASRTLQDGVTGGLAGIATSVREAHGVRELGQMVEALRAELGQSAADRRREGQELVSELRRLTAAPRRPGRGRT